MYSKLHSQPWSQMQHKKLTLRLPVGACRWQSALCGPKFIPKLTSLLCLIRGGVSPAFCDCCTAKFAPRRSGKMRRISHFFDTIYAICPIKHYGMVIASWNIHIVANNCRLHTNTCYEAADTFGGIFSRYGPKKIYCRNAGGALSNWANFHTYLGQIGFKIAQKLLQWPSLYTTWEATCNGLTWRNISKKHFVDCPPPWRKRLI